MTRCNANRRAGWCRKPSPTVPPPSASAGSVRVSKPARHRPATPSTPAVSSRQAIRVAAGPWRLAGALQAIAAADQRRQFLFCEAAVVAAEVVFQATGLAPPDEAPEVG